MLTYDKIFTKIGVASVFIIHYFFKTTARCINIYQWQMIISKGSVDNVRVGIQFAFIIPDITESQYFMVHSVLFSKQAAVAVLIRQDIQNCRLHTQSGCFCTFDRRRKLFMVACQNNPISFQHGIPAFRFQRLRCFVYDHGFEIHIF